MAEVTNYYHSESGVVADRGYLLDEPDMPRTYALSLLDDPHHELAYDYGSDIAIDPQLDVGDKAVYVRLDSYAGIWVRERDQFYPELQKAISRALRERSGDWMEPAISGETRRKGYDQFSERPATEASFFLSFSSKNVLLARQIFESLKHDAKVEVWFDLDQEGESPTHVRRIQRWLREAVYNSRGLVLLWTEAAGRSRWVRRELAWAAEKASHDPDFHLVVLKRDEEPVPTDLPDTGFIVDCYDLWPMHGVREELFAAVAGRQGRTAWLEEHRRQGVEAEQEGVLADPKDGYEPFRSDSGVVVTLRHWEENGKFCWRLEYEKDRRLHKVIGRCPDQAVDLSIRTGDHVGFFSYAGRPLWMRSRDLRIKPNDVLATYMQRIRA